MVTWGSNTTTVFGAGSNPSGFSFGGGGAPSTPPAASTPAPTNPPPLWGGATTTSTTTAWGQPAASGGLFGSSAPAPAPTAGGLFASAPAPAPTGFGTTHAPAAGGLFGPSTPAPASGGLFGAPLPAYGGFGTQQPHQQVNPYGGFGTQQPQQHQANPHQAALHAHQSALQRQDAARIEEAIFNLHGKYSPNAADPLNPALASNNIPSSLCAFTAILYDPLPPENRARGQLSVPKPSHISNQTWTEALARNPDPKELMPIPILGAPALHSRIVSQQERANALAMHAKKLRETLLFLEKSANSSKDAIKRSNLDQEALRRRLLEIMRKVEIIRCMGQPTQRAEVEAQQRLGEIMKQVNLVGKTLANLEERGRQQARAWRMKGATMESRQSDIGLLPMEEEDKVALFQVLNGQRLGMERLGSIVKRDVRDAGIMKDELNKASSGRVKASSSGAAIFGGR